MRSKKVQEQQIILITPRSTTRETIKKINALREHQKSKSRERLNKTRANSELNSLHQNTSMLSINHKITDLQSKVNELFQETHQKNRSENQSVQTQNYLTVYQLEKECESRLSRLGIKSMNLFHKHLSLEQILSRFQGEICKYFYEKYSVQFRNRKTDQRGNYEVNKQHKNILKDQNEEILETKINICKKNCNIFDENYFRVSVDKIKSSTMAIQDENLTRKIKLQIEKWEEKNNFSKSHQIPRFGSKQNLLKKWQDLFHDLIANYQQLCTHIILYLVENYKNQKWRDSLKQQSPFKDSLSHRTYTKEEFRQIFLKGFTKDEEARHSSRKKQDFSKKKDGRQ